LTSVDPRIADVFAKLIKDCDAEKLQRIDEEIKALKAQGKTTARAMADALETFKLAGPVNA